MATPNALEQLLTEHEVAKILRVSVATMRRRRLLNHPPTWIKIGASVRYTPESISAFLKSRPSGGEQLTPAASNSAGER
jgi:predicted DNA-binding transcriptional regulator AlpA